METARIEDIKYDSAETCKKGLLLKSDSQKFVRLEGMGWREGSLYQLKEEYGENLEKLGAKELVELLKVAYASGARSQAIKEMVVKKEEERIKKDKLLFSLLQNFKESGKSVMIVYDSEEVKVFSAYDEDVIRVCKKAYGVWGGKCWTVSLSKKEEVVSKLTKIYKEGEVIVHEEI